MTSPALPISTFGAAGLLPLLVTAGGPPAAAPSVLQRRTPSVAPRVVPLGVP